MDMGMGMGMGMGTGMGMDTWALHACSSAPSPVHGLCIA
jgi:hypothetical protein